MARAVPSAGFTILELLVTLTIAAAIASMIVPMLSDDSRLRVMAAASIVASDIEMAQVMTIAHPQQPVTVRFVPSQGRYWLAYAATPDTPLTREDTGLPYEVTLGSGRARGATGVKISVEGMTGDRITFAAHGGLTNFTSTPRVKVMAGSRGIALTIAPTTGSVRESEFSPTAGDLPPIEVGAFDKE